MGLLYTSKMKLVFNVPFKSQGYIRSGPQHLVLVRVEPTQRRQPVIRCQTCLPLGHCGPREEAVVISDHTSTGRHCV